MCYGVRYFERVGGEMKGDKDWVEKCEKNDSCDPQRNQMQNTRACVGVSRSTHTHVPRQI